MTPSFESREGTARVALDAAAWLALSLGAPLLFHELLLGLASATDTRVIEAAAGTLLGSLVFGMPAAALRESSKISAPVRSVLVVAFLGTSLSSTISPFPFSLAIRFALLSAAITASIVHAGQAFHEGERHPATWIVLASLLAGSTWVQRESYHVWSAALATIILVAATVTVAALATVHLVMVRAGGVPGTPEPHGDSRARIRAPGVAAAIAFFLGTVPGLYMSLSKLVVENTAINSPSTVVSIINAALVAGVAVLVLSDRAGLLARTGSGPAGLLSLLGGIAVLVGLPWILGTTRAVTDTTAGTWHVAGLLVVPVIGSFMLVKLLDITVTPGYLVLVPILGGLGFITGIAGYLFGGTTYRMDFYIGAAFTVLLLIGVIVAWTTRYRERKTIKEVSIVATA